MQLQIKRKFIIYLDEDEAELFMDDARHVQNQIRAELGQKTVAGATANFAKRNLPSAPLEPKPKAKATKLPNAPRRAMKRVACPDCQKPIAAHWLERHRNTAHPQSAAVPSAVEPSAE